MNNIRELRDRTNLSQSEFAKKYDIPLSTLRKWEQLEANPAPYFVKLLAQSIPANNDKLEKIVYKDGSTYYYDSLSASFYDITGNKITVNENLEGVKRENLPFYVKDMFDAYYELQNQFISDCEYDKKEDYIWC